MKDWFKISVIIILLAGLLFAVYTVGRRDGLTNTQTEPAKVQTLTETVIEPALKQQKKQQSNHKEYLYYSTEADTVATQSDTVVPTPKPDQTQIMQSLIGQKISKGFSRWVFASLDEFKEFTVISENLTDYGYQVVVMATLQGYGDSSVHYARLSIRYDNIQGVWYLSKIKVLDYM